jgi:hypothetical protein
VYVIAGGFKGIKLKRTAEPKEEEKRSEFTVKGELK